MFGAVAKAAARQAMRAAVPQKGAGVFARRSRGRPGPGEGAGAGLRPAVAGCPQAAGRSSAVQGGGSGAGACGAALGWRGPGAGGAGCSTPWTAWRQLSRCGQLATGDGQARCGMPMWRVGGGKGADAPQGDGGRAAAACAERQCRTLRPGGLFFAARVVGFWAAITPAGKRLCRRACMPGPWRPGKSAALTPRGAKARGGRPARLGPVHWAHWPIAPAASRASKKIAAPEQGCAKTAFFVPGRCGVQAGRVGLTASRSCVGRRGTCSRR